MSYTSNPSVLWKDILDTLATSPQDIQTVLQDGSGGLWIHAKTENGVVEIDRARDKIPSSGLSTPRYISEKEFVSLYPLYFQWRKGAISREKAKGGSMKSSYIFALIHKFEDE